MTTKAELFAAYGSDVPAMLAAWPNLDPLGYQAWSGAVEERMLTTEYRRWLRSQTTTVDRAIAARNSGQAHLFDAPEAAPDAIAVRSTIVHDGDTHSLLGLSGHIGAKMLREAMLRDLGPASTTVDRCRYGIALADHIDAETDRLGRPVTVAEVVGLVAA